MARKRTKEEAKKRLASLPSPPGILGKLPGAPGLATRALRASQGLAGLLIDIDPLNRLAEPTPTPPKVTKEAPKVDRNEVVMRMVNDPGIKIDENMRAAINDDAIMMAPSLMGLEYVGIIATNDFFVQINGSGNTGAKAVTGKLYGYRARADADIFSALVQSEVLSA